MSEIFPDVESKVISGKRHLRFFDGWLPEDHPLVTQVKAILDKYTTPARCPTCESDLIIDYNTQAVCYACGTVVRPPYNNR